MPLPEGGNVPWPPEAMAPVYAKIAEHASWYSGDIEQLQMTYAGAGGTNDTNGFFASESGGFRGAVNRVVNSVRRWFWGQRQTGNQQRNRVHVPLAAHIAQVSGDLLFSEPLKVSVPVEVKLDGTKAIPDGPTQTALDELMDDSMYACLLESAEVCAALGGVYLRVIWDKDFRDRPWISSVHPDAAIPEWRYGELSAVTFWKECRREGKFVYRHLERHELGRVLHGLYRGDSETLGMPIPLTEDPSTAGLVEYLSNGNEVQTGTKRLTAVYVPNMRPNRMWRNMPAAVHYGRSDYAGLEALLDSLDMVQSSLMRDVELGKARLIVPQEYLTSHGPGRGSSVDLDREVYEGINAMGDAGGKPEIKEVQFEIRVEDHVRTADYIKGNIVTSAGYSLRTFGLGDTAPKTATEVAAEERHSNITRDRKTRYWRPKLGDILQTWLEVYKYAFGVQVLAVRPQIDWPPAVSVDPKALAEELELLERAKAISTKQKVKRLNPDWPDEEVDEEVELIDATVEDPETFTGEPGDEPPDKAIPQE